MLEEVKMRVEKALPGAQVHITDFTGTGDHLEANVIWAGFEGLSRLQQHRKIYEALDGLVGFQFGNLLGKFALCSMRYVAGKLKMR